jgi:hypothetical protein
MMLNIFRKVKEENSKFVIKISDFGLSREIDAYYTAEEYRTVPIKWTAPGIYIIIQ